MTEAYADPEGNEPDMVNTYVTCRTEGCPNAGATVFFAEIYGTMLCGGCSRPITEITDTEPEQPVPPTEVPEWLE